MNTRNESAKARMGWKKALFMLVAAGMLLSACESGAIWDYVSASMVVRITDDADHNLLDTTVVGNLFQNGMGTLEVAVKVNMDDEEYTRSESAIRTLKQYWEDWEATRTYIGPWAGAVLTTDPCEGDAVLFIGEISEFSSNGEIDLILDAFKDQGKRREVVLKFADGRSAKIYVWHYADLRHKLHTKARLAEASEGLNVSIDFSTKYTIDYLTPEKE